MLNMGVVFHQGGSPLGGTPQQNLDLGLRLGHLKGHG